MVVELALEQHRQQLGRAARGVAAREQSIEARVVMGADLVDAPVQAAERPAVGGQHERTLRQRTQVRERSQEQRQGIRLGLVDRQADVRRDLGQHLVTGDEDPQLLAVQAGVLGGVSGGHHHPPSVRPDLDVLAVGEPSVCRRGRRDQVAVAISARGEAPRERLGETVASKEINLASRLARIGVGVEKGPGEPLGAGHPHRGTDLGVQPARQAEMIGMVVGDDDPRDGASVQPVVQQPAPQLLHLLARDPRVDQRPARAVLHEPQVDVVESEGQRHAQPVHSRSDRPFAAGPGHVAAQVVDRAGRTRTGAPRPLGAGGRLVGPALASRRRNATSTLHAALHSHDRRFARFKSASYD